MVLPRRDGAFGGIPVSEGGDINSSNLLVAFLFTFRSFVRSPSVDLLQLLQYYTQSENFNNIFE